MNSIMEQRKAEAAARSEPLKAVNVASRQGDSFLGNDQDQLGRMMNMMRRIEDLSDRVIGPVPTSPECSGGLAEQLPGFIGSLVDLHAHRERVMTRCYEALDRIEQVL